MEKSNLRKLTMLAVLSAISFVVMLVGRVPMMSIPGLTLKYDPKDIIIIIGGFMYGPLSAAAISLIVSFFEMIFASETGPIGLLMNVVSSCSFACTAAIIYKYKRTLSGAVTGIISGAVLTAFVMVLWNYLITPIYVGIPRAAVVPFLMPFFLPFNLIKGGINAAAAMIIYKPTARVIRMFAPSEDSEKKYESNILVILTAAAVIVICLAMVFLIFN